MENERVRGRVIYREWTETEGLRETEGEFTTLDELFALCLRPAEEMLIDRMILSGVSGDGDTRTITFTFRDSTGHEA